MLAGFSVIVSSGITLVVRRLSFSPCCCCHVYSPWAQIFFPRSIETEIAAHDAGARSRGLFSSRHHLTLISQEQELCGTYVYDPEDTPVDSNADSPSSIYKTAAYSPSSTSDIYAPAYTPPQLPPGPPPPPPAQQLPAPEPIRLTPNRRQPSLDSILPPPGKQLKQPQLRPLSIADRFNNPATNVSRLKQTFRSHKGA
jgi:hypothetical protein